MYDLFIELPGAARAAPPAAARCRSGILADGRVLRPLDEAAAREAMPAGCSRRASRRVAICLLHAYVNPGARTPRGRAGRRDGAGPRRLVLVRGRPGDPRVRAHVDHRGQRLRAAAHGAVPRRPRGAPAARWASRGGFTSCCRRAASRRPATARALPHSADGVRARGRGPGRGAWPRARRGELRPALLRHGGHHGQGVRDRRRSSRSWLASSRWRAPTASRRAPDCPCASPVIEMIEIGAGGGSIARVDRLGLLKVGPDSAGADPGSGLLRAAAGACPR